jgi:hypothetical protein
MPVKETRIVERERERVEIVEDDECIAVQMGGKK